MLSEPLWTIYNFHESFKIPKEFLANRQKIARNLVICSGVHENLKNALLTFIKSWKVLDEPFDPSTKASKDSKSQRNALWTTIKSSEVLWLII